eukprot:RCo038302
MQQNLSEQLSALLLKISCNEELEQLSYTQKRNLLTWMRARSAQVDADTDRSCLHLTPADVARLRAVNRDLRSRLDRIEARWEASEKAHQEGRADVLVETELQREARWRAEEDRRHEMLAKEHKEYMASLRKELEQVEAPSVEVARPPVASGDAASG